MKNTHKLAFFLCTWLCLSNTYKVSDFETSILKPSHPSGYYNVMTGDDIIGEILCFGDINGDQYTDYVAVADRSAQQITIYFWDFVKSEFIKDSFVIVDDVFELNVDTIQEAMLTDLTDDGVNDVILTVSSQDTENPDNISTRNYRTIIFQVTSCQSYKCSYQYRPVQQGILDGMSSSPFLMNLDGEGSPQFLVFKGENRYLANKKSRGNNLSYNLINFAEFVNNGNKPTSFNQVQNHYSSNIDYTGDCHSDLVILSKDSSNKSVLQFYEKQTNSKFHISNTLKFDKQILFYTFIDIDSSGTVDIALIVKDSDNESKMYIIKSRRDQPEKLCDDSGVFPYEVSDMKFYDLGYNLANNSYLHFGDVNSDSYPDLLVIVKMRDFRNAVLFKNSRKDNQRYFRKSQDLNADQIQEIKNPQQVAFFDLAEDGKIDLLVMGQDIKDSDGTSVITRTAVMNNVKDDTLFIKILPLSQQSQYKIGSNTISQAFGITIQWVITELSGSKKIQILNQRSQWNHGTLQLPFACGGLGRTNNYVEDLTVGYEGVGKAESWSPVIPNSKLLVYKDEGEWKLQTLLTNSQRVNQVIYVSIVILCVLGFIIFFLNYREKKQDRKDQYNFIQLIR